MSIDLIISIIAYIVAIWSGYFRFKKEQYQTCFHISSSFSVFFLLMHLEYKQGWHWFYSMALPLVIYFVTIMIVKQIATRGGENSKS